MRLSAVVGVVLLTGAHAVCAATRDDAAVQRWINTHAQRSHSDELAPARLSVVGDLDGESRSDLAVLYTLRPHGQHSERRYLAVFKRQRAGSHDGLHYHAHVLVGATGTAEVNRATIINKAVVIEMLTRRAGDAACCPTRPATRRYRLVPRGLVVVKEPVKSQATRP